MAGLHLHRSNRLELLADALAGVLDTAPAAPLAPECIVVQSLGMRRWLSLELAARFGVMMNIDFPFPAGFVQHVLAAAAPENATSRVFDRAVLPWRILALFPRVLDRPAFAELRRYVQGEVAPLKKYQLANKIAAVFDRYLAYRPELILRWQRGEEEHWQAQLWRELARGRERAHPPALAEHLRLAKADFSKLPRRLAIFGISSLPPFYLQFFGEIAKHLDLHFFLLDPTEQYWGDLVSAKERDHILRREKKQAVTAEALHLETGNTLLASFGRLGRDFSRLVLDLEPASESESFARPAAPTLLGQLQAAIFDVQDGTVKVTSGSDECREAPPRHSPLAPDTSLQIHCCHSSTRELEVLHDQLLALFAADPALTPRDILVTMPDVETYAPFIEAVFGAPDAPEHRIPFSIADRSARSESSLADAFLRILDLAGSRFGAGRVLALLETESIQRRFGLEAGDLELIRSWIERTAIRWGIDAAHRADLGLPAFAENTWRAGLRRLLLGYALPGDDHTLFAGILPVREIEGGLALVLGRFVDFAEALFEKVRGFHDARPLGEWARTFRDVLQTFFDERDESADAIRRLRATLDGLADLESISLHEEPVEFEVIRAHLASALADSDSGAGFLAGRLTFCALKPMRSIPFKVICLLGLDDGKFPRRDAALAFDLVATQPRAGDRTLRDDDRHLFLETLLSARDTLYLSYCGLSPRDNREAPPSVLISELLDYLRENFALPEDFVTRHRLQPFSPSYFDGRGPLFSHSAENCRASVRSRAERQPPPPFATAPLPAPDAEWRALDIQTLADFFTNPARTFIRDRLGIRLPDEAELLDEREPLEIGPLARMQLQGRIARRGLATGDLDGAHAVLRAGGELPAGYVGEARFREMRGEVAEYVTKLREALAGEPLPPLPLDLSFGEWRLTGTLQDLRAGQLVRSRATSIKPADFLRAWVLHLALNAAAPADYPRETLLLGTDDAHRFIPVEDARGALAALLELYAAGLRAPLKFFPKSSHEFARRTLRATKNEKKSPLAAAQQVWRGNDFCEADDAHFAHCFAHTDPLDAEWERLAIAVFKPLFEHLAPEAA